MRLEQYNCICVLTQVGVCVRLTCLSICLLFKTSVQNCTHIHTGLKRLWERAFGRNFNREGKKIKRTRESKTQHTYVRVNASYQLKELFLDSVAVWQRRISWCSGFYLNFTVKPKPMKKQQGGILEITGPMIARINIKEQKKQRNQWWWKRHKDREGEKKKQILPNNCITDVLR